MHLRLLDDYLPFHHFVGYPRVVFLLSANINGSVIIQFWCKDFNATEINFADLLVKPLNNRYGYYGLILIAIQRNFYFLEGEKYFFKVMETQQESNWKHTKLEGKGVHKFIYISQGAAQFVSNFSAAATPTQGFIFNFFFFLFSLTARKITLLIRFRRNYIHVSAVENGGD